MTDKMTRDEVLDFLDSVCLIGNHARVAITADGDLEAARRAFSRIAGRLESAEKTRTAVSALVDEVEALRAKMAFLESCAIKNDAYDIYGGGAHWYIGIHTNDGRLTFGGVLDEAIARAKSGA